MTPPEVPTPSADRGGWRSTSAQGLVLARWAAAELAAQRVDRLTWVAWVVGGLGLVAFAVGLPVDPGWPFVALGIVLVLAALTIRVAIAVVVAVLRWLALPRRARHLRAEATAARGRLRDVLVDSGVPVSLGHALGFTWALVRGRRPHSRVAGELKGLSGRLVAAAEVEHLRARLAEATGPPPPPGDGSPDQGPG